MDENAYIVSRGGDPTREYCPTCQPDLDPLTGLWVVCYCSAHLVPPVGQADVQATEAALSTGYLTLLSDAGGENNRLWCNFFHRKELPPK